jgi:hypothetical protein
MVVAEAAAEAEVPVGRLPIIQHTLKDTHTIQRLTHQDILILEEVEEQELLLVLLVLVRILQDMVRE